MQYGKQFIKAPFSGRENFGSYLNSIGAYGVAVEIGVHHAVFAKQLLNQWRGRLYVGIDFWEPVTGLLLPALPGESLQANGRDRLRDFSLAVENLKDSPVPTCLMKSTSYHASHLFHDGTFDFVYIDGDHSERAVSEDLQRWWPKVRSGGVLAGHDLCMPQVKNFDWAHIQSVVERFFVPLGLPIHVVEDNQTAWSWFVRKDAQ